MSSDAPAALAPPTGTYVLGLVGAGFMGSGIAQVAAMNGLEVRLFDSADGIADRGRESVAASLARLVEKGRVEAEAVERAMSRITVVDDLDEVALADAVIEAVIEELPVKQQIFATLGSVAPAHTLLATNTSALPITAIAAGCSAADRVVGMHFFSPVPLMRLCEVIRGYRTSDATVTNALALAETLGKKTIVVNRDDAGFVTSRLVTILTQEAMRIVEEGLATPADVDLACELGFGHKLGPLATVDLTGLDVSLRAGRATYEQSGQERFFPPQILARLVAAGDLGRKTGRGFHDYGAGNRKSR